MADLIDRQKAIDALLGITTMRNTIPLDSAIFNIKKLPSAQPTQPNTPNALESLDCISRQAAIDALERLKKDISGDYTNLDPLVMAGTGYIGDCIGELQDLPSAQPEQPSREYVEQLKWERDLAIQQLKDLGYGLGENPRTQPEIVRCFDCKNSPLKTWFNCPLAHLPFDGGRWCWKGERDDSISD